MSDNRKDLQEFAQNLSISKIEEEGNKKALNYFIKDTRPYFKKQNLNCDKAQWTCWQVHTRCEIYDLFVTVLRRAFHEKRRKLNNTPSERGWQCTYNVKYPILPKC